MVSFHLSLVAWSLRPGYPSILLWGYDSFPIITCCSSKTMVRFRLGVPLFNGTRTFSLCQSSALDIFGHHASMREGPFGAEKWIARSTKRAPGFCPTKAAPGRDPPEGEPTEMEKKAVEPALTEEDRDGPWRVARNRRGSSPTPSPSSVRNQNIGENAHIVRFFCARNRHTIFGDCQEVKMR